MTCRNAACRRYRLARSIFRPAAIGTGRFGHGYAVRLATAAVVIVLASDGLRCSVPSGGAEGNMAEGLISDPETDEIVAIIRGGEVYRFHNDTEGPKFVVGSQPSHLPAEGSTAYDTPLAPAS
jgi:hypothetical protein